MSSRHLKILLKADHVIYRDIKDVWHYQVFKGMYHIFFEIWKDDSYSVFSIFYNKSLIRADSGSTSFCIEEILKVYTPNPEY
jgi:hypothetical protein